MIKMKTPSIRYFCGATYQGSWQQGKRHGYGEMAWPGSGSYKGFFKDDFYHGQGVMTYDFGDKYAGEWKDGVRHGQGIWTMAEGGIYTGNFANGQINGQGVFTHPAGNQVYTGQWKEGWPDGHGIITSDTLETLVGLRIIKYPEDDVYVQPYAVIKQSPRYKYIGPWRNGVFHGQAVLYVYGKKYIRHFKNGFPWKPEVLSFPSAKYKSHNFEANHD